MQTFDDEEQADDNRQSLDKIKANCLSLLTRREHSQQELLFKLLAKGFKKTDIMVVITELAEQNWQNDQRFAESYTRHCLQRGYGSFYISYQLKQRGVHAFDIDSVAIAYVGSWENHLQQVYEHKYGQTPVTNKQEWTKRNRFLQQRGFSPNLINHVLTFQFPSKNKLF